MARHRTGLTELQFDSALELHESLSRQETNSLRILMTAPGFDDNEHPVSTVIPEIQSGLQRRFVSFIHLRQAVAEMFKDRVDMIEERESEVSDMEEGTEAETCELGVSRRR